MAQYLTIARPYAQALFDYAGDDMVKLNAWSQVLQVLALMVADKKIARVMTDPQVAPVKLRSFLLELIHAVVEDEANLLAEPLKHFIQLLLEHKRLLVSPDILKLYKELLAGKQEILPVEFTSAFDLADNQQQEIREMLSKKFNSKVFVEFKTDKKLIGGGVVRTDRFVMDGSVKGKLERLYHSLMS